MAFDMAILAANCNGQKHYLGASERYSIIRLDVLPVQGQQQ
jgi:hypothetical protein